MADDTTSPQPDEAELDALRARWFGASAPLTDVDHVVDLAARRLALMPLVARAKRARGQPIEDAEREQRVLADVTGRAAAAGLDASGVRELFTVQIELARRVQERTPDGPAHADLERELRPALSALGAALIDALARAAPLASDSLADRPLAPLTSLLEPAELARLCGALLAVRRTRV